MIGKLVNPGDPGSLPQQDRRIIGNEVSKKDTFGKSASFVSGLAESSKRLRMPEEESRQGEVIYAGVRRSDLEQSFSKIKKFSTL